MTTPETPEPTDWAQLARKALETLMWAGAVAGTIYAINVTLDDLEQDSPTPISNDEHFVEAARVLRVSAGATSDEIRAALRARLAETRSHPDQGGDEEQAKKLIAAKNLLMQRAHDRG